MKTFRIFPLIAFFAAVLFFSGCKEATEGIDEVSKEVTGQNKIEKKIELEDKIKKLTDQRNEEQADALKKVSE